MRALRRSSFLRYIVIPLTLMAWLSACHKWSYSPLSPSQAVSEGPDRVRVTTPSERVVLYSPRVEGDSIIGSLPITGGRQASSICEIERLETRQFDVLWTVPTVLGVTVVTGFVVLAALCGFDENCFEG
jgi:hypothetical protein